MTPSTKALGIQIFKEPLDFDFYLYTTNNLLEIADNKNFVNINDVNRFLGRRYCLPKEQIKMLLKNLRELGYLKIEKRGVRLL